MSTEGLTSIPSGIYTIPAGEPFADALVSVLLEQTKGAPENLANYTILLPTRRACRNMRDAFLRCSDGVPLLLPRLQPIGDIDEEELSLEIAGTGQEDTFLALPPAISTMRRQALLARTIISMDGYTNSPDQAFALAQALGRLMDQIHTEGLDIKNLATLVPEDFAEHWQVTLDFLKILMEHWPAILEEHGVIDAADRRNRLIETLANHWQQNPPDGPIIAAGSTGSIPATGRLLKVISGLPQGTVVLPDLDKDLDEDSWNALDDTHPQATLRQLLHNIGITREDVRSWPYGTLDEALRARHNLATELMRPAATTQHWMSLSQTLSGQDHDHIAATLENVRRFDCDTVQEEATLIGVILRETLEQKEQTAALITPDRNLARRVATVCQRWGITIDDSGGRKLSMTPKGSFLHLTLQACETALAPAAFSEMLKHECFHLGYGKEELSRLIQIFEKKCLRGSKPPPGIGGLKTRLDDDITVQFMDHLEPVISPLLALCEGGKEHDFRDILDCHIKTIETLYIKDTQNENDTGWTGEDGEAAALFLTELRELSYLMPRVTTAQYGAILSSMMSVIMVRPSFGMHPRLSILGQLEARLVQADIVIMAGLNEGTWPPDPGHDPWMSRPMRKNFGLPAPERSIGLSAHDFVQGFCAKRVIMTRSRRVDGAPTVPARWLQRLDTVMHALSIDPDELSSASYPFYAKELDRHEETTPWPRPEPCPPQDKRPDTLYVTQIEKWIRDPYSLYAQKILNLKKLKPLEEAADAAIRGTIIHDVLHEFIDRHRDNLPDNALKILLELGRDTLEQESIDRESLEFWWPRFERLAEWFIEHEKTWQTKAKPCLTEEEGTMCLTGASGRTFSIKAKADRIDRLNDGSVAIIDYKTGTPPSNTDVKKGLSPQMPLEAAIVLDKDNGFPLLNAENIGYIGFWHLSGGSEPGKEVEIKDKNVSLNELAEQARQGVTVLFDTYDNDNIPYISLPRPDYAPPLAYQDYAHLARVSEWADLDDSEGDT